jgi:hypothetical protein
LVIGPGGFVVCCSTGTRQLVAALIPTVRLLPHPILPRQTKGTVTGVEDFGAIVEWAAADGAKRSGLLHVSEMRAPAALAAAEFGDDAGRMHAAAPAGGDEGEERASMFADEGEFAGEAYWDVGGIDKPSRYYKVRVFSFMGGRGWHVVHMWCRLLYSSYLAMTKPT